MAVWQTILLAITGNALALTVLGWLAKSVVAGWLSKDLETHKAKLQSEGSVALERLKHNLELVGVEHQVRFSKLHDKQAEVIGQLYALLVDGFWAASSFASMIEWNGEPAKSEKYVTAMNALAEFFRYFDKNRIYIPPDICEQLDAFLQEMRHKIIGFGTYVRMNEEGLPQHVLEEKHRAWEEAWRYFSEEVPKARAALEKELRTMLGH